MADIFGYRQPEDYAHLRSLRDQVGTARFESEVRSYADRHGGSWHFESLGSFGERTVSDAQVYGFATDNLLHIVAAIDEWQYLRNRYQQFFPLRTDIDENASSYAHQITDTAGMGAFLDNRGKNVPVAGVTHFLDTQSLRYAGINAVWNIEQLRAAMKSMLPLPMKAINAAMTGASNHIETVGMLGDSSRGLNGFTNLATGSGANQVTRVDFAHSEWDAATPATAAQIRVAITSAINGIISDSNEIFGRELIGPMAVYLPPTQFNIVASEPVSDSDTQRSIWSYVEMFNGWTARQAGPVEMHSVQELTGAGAGSDEDRMVVAVKTDDVFELPISIMPRVLKMEDKGREFCVQIEYKFGGLYILRYGGLHYTDGI